MSILEDKFEGRAKFYEPEYSIVNNSRSLAFRMCADEQVDKADVRFRETES